MPRQVAALAALVLVAALGAAGCGSSPEPSGRPQPSPRGQLLGLTATASIGAGGGTVTSPDGRLTVTIPAGALPGPVNVTVDQITDTAPGKIDDVAYRIGPADTILLAPVTLVFRAAAPGSSLDAFTVAYQENQGFWLRLREVLRTPADGTLTVATTHFGDWSIVTRSTADLNGQITFQSTIGIPFSATGIASLNVAGGDSSGTYYLQWGTLTLDSATLTSGAATCTASPATVALDTDIAEVLTNPARFRWGTTARWPLTCSAGGAPYSDLASLFFDTMGIYRPDCTRAYVQGPLITADRVQGSYTIDCGTAGAVTATWDLGTCTPGGACAMACHDAVISCDTGFPVCTATATWTDGTSCGANLVCSGGACVSCTAGLACTTQPDTLCHDGVTSCATGTSQCVNGAALPNGTSCGSNLVCNGGACVACASGLACTTQPDPLCHAGVTSCATGTSQCVNGAALPDGTSCGADQVCNGGACLSCTAGLACATQPDPLCHAGVTSCATGTSQCVNGAALPNGTSCGADQVCNGGACLSCTAGLACTTQPDTLCHAGVTSCATGTSQCVNGTALPNGTSCGSNLVCNGGACVACASGVACSTQPDPLCHDGVTSCATGTSQCVNGTARPNGTSCGADQVCNGGACVSCTTGLACTTQPDPLCHAGVTSCASGTSQCVNGAALADGTSCGADQVCNGGACVACASGVACTTQPDTLCHAGVTSCATGTSQCLDGDAKANGTPCGADMVCNGGACVSCTANLACAPANPCHEGRTSCSTGTQTCTDLGTNAPNGTSCGAGLTCNDGGCVPSRNVTGTRLVTYWPDGTPAAPVPAPDVIAPPLALVAALVPRAGGGFDTYTGTIDPSGSILVANVPAGPYLLSFVDGNGAHTFLETSSSTIDLGYDVLGRADAALATASTPVTLELAGLTPWTAGDEIQITSSNGDVFDAPSRNATIAAGATSASLVDDWFASALGPAMNLLAPADVLWIHDLATSSTTQTAGPTTYPYLSASAAVSVTGLALASGSPSTVPATLLPPAGTEWVTGDAATGIDWRLSEFEAQLPAMTGLVAMPAGSGHVLLVGAAARALANPAPIASGNPTLFQLALDAGTGNFATAASLSYGSFLEAATWSEWRGIEFGVPVAYVKLPASVPFTDRAVLGRREAVSAGLPTPIVPTLLAVQAPALNGLDAFAPLAGVGTTPTLTWSAPPTPSLVPTSYTVEIVLLGTSGASTVATRVALWRVASTAVVVPANLLSAGGTYYARITANWSSPEPLATKPLSGEYVTAYATTLTGAFSP